MLNCLKEIKNSGTGIANDRMSIADIYKFYNNV
jgi:hypothetical protein